jgi:serine/threonine protein kinase
MSTYTSEPGTKLAGRYRLADQISGGSGWTLWKAIDETLARPVTVLTFAPGFPRISEVVTAARAASRLTDPRLAQVFDVEDTGESAYVVMEWLTGQTLTDLLSEGPLDAGRAVTLVLESAQALAAAHAAGQAHLRLSPQALRWTRSGGVKISGLGIDAALSGPAMTTTADEPGLADTQGLARLLYAALTGYWPGEEPGPLPPAPAPDGRILSPRQVSADVPAAVDEVLCRALWQRSTKHGPAITSAADLADNLAAVAPPVPLPEPAPAPAPPPRMPSSGFHQVEDTSQWSLPPGGTGIYRPRRPKRQTDPATRAIVSVVIVLVLVAVGATAWMLSSALHHGHPSANAGTGGHHSSSPSAAAVVTLTPSQVGTYDIKESGDDPSGASSVIGDGTGQGPWHTSYYLNNPKFGGLKTGTGLIFDMGKEVNLSSISIQFGTSCCTSYEVAIGDDNTQTPSGLQSLTVLGSSGQGAGNTKLSFNSKATGRYVVIWLTSLAPYSQGPANSYEAQIYHVVLQGSAARASG